MPGQLFTQLDGHFIFSIFYMVILENFKGLGQPVSQNLNLGPMLSRKLCNLKRRIISQGGNPFREKEKLAGIFPPEKNGSEEK